MSAFGSAQRDAWIENEEQAGIVAARVNAGMRTTEDALRWALMRIANSGLGQGEYFERATQLLVREECLRRQQEAEAAAQWEHDNTGPGHPGDPGLF